MNKAQVIHLLMRNDRAVMQAITFLQAQQTTDEQNSKETIHRNGRGWSSHEAEFGASLAQQIQKHGTLTRRQIQCGRKMAVYHAQQLADLNCFESKPKRNLLELLGFRPMPYPQHCNPVERVRTHCGVLTGSFWDNQAMLFAVEEYDPFAVASVSPPCSVP